jgi:hypothetical protein
MATSRYTTLCLKQIKIYRFAAGFAAQDNGFEAWMRDTQMVQAGKGQNIEAMNEL